MTIPNSGITPEVTLLNWPSRKSSPATRHMARRFRPPWSSERIPGGYVVKDATGQSLAYVYARETCISAYSPQRGKRSAREGSMNGTVYNDRLEGARYGVSFGTALAIAISHTNNHSILWAIIHGIFSGSDVIYFVLFK